MIGKYLKRDETVRIWGVMNIFVTAKTKKRDFFATETLHTPEDVVPILLSSGGIGNAQHAHP